MKTIPQIMAEFGRVADRLRSRCPELDDSVELLPTLIRRNNCWHAGIAVDLPEAQAPVWYLPSVCVAQSAPGAMNMVLDSLERMPPHIEVDDLLRR